MFRLMRNDAMKVLLFLVGSVALGMLMLPLLHSLGMAARELSEEKLTNFMLWRFSNYSTSATLVDIFRGAVTISAVLLLPFLLKALTSSSAHMKVQARPWQLLLSPRTHGSSRRGALINCPSKMRDFISAFLFAATLITVAVVLAWQRGTLAAASSIDWSHVRNSCLLALVMAILTEILLRGVLLGIFLRTYSAFTAVLLVSLLGTLSYAWQSPVAWVDPPVVGFGAGWQVFQAMIRSAVDAKHLTGWFLPALVFGMLLGFVRYRSASLYACSGLHAAGSVMFTALPYFFTSRLGDPTASFFQMAGYTSAQGLFAISTAVAISIVLLRYTHRSFHEKV